MSALANILKKDPREPRLTKVYDIDTVLGKSAYGVVLRVINTSTGEAAACKSISKSKLVCKEDVEDVQQEIEMLNHVDGHPNIVSIIVRQLLCENQLSQRVFDVLCRAHMRTETVFTSS